MNMDQKINLTKVKLGDILGYEQPTKYLVDDKNKTFIDNKTGIPVLTPGQTFVLGYTEESNGIYRASKEDPVIIFDDFTTSFKWVDFDFKVKSSAIKFLKVKDKNKTSLRYLFYVMSDIKFNVETHQRQWIARYSQQEIILPSLEEQKRIVQELDVFTALITPLRTEEKKRTIQVLFN